MKRFTAGISRALAPSSQLQLQHDGTGKTRKEEGKRLGRVYPCCVVIFVLLGVGVVDFSRLQALLFDDERGIHKDDGVSSSTILTSQERTTTQTNKSRDGFFTAPQCSDDQVAALAKLFYTHIIHQNASEVSDYRRFHTPLMRKTKCPDETWVQRYFAKSQQASFLGINIGCNKGADAVSMAQLLSRNAKLDPGIWDSALGSRARAVCPIPKNIPQSVNNATLASGKVYCIEPMPATVQSLERAVNTTPSVYSEHIVIQHAAMSNTSGFTMFPDASDGQEDFSLAACDSSSTNTTTNTNTTIATAGQSSCLSVPMYTLDDFINEKVDTNSNRHGEAEQDIDMLLIDAEGFDFEVLQGAQNALERVKYLVFEVHILGNWMKHSLVNTVETVLKDFTCYWAGRGRLWRMTNCFGANTTATNHGLIEKLYELKSWSNVACVHKSQLGLSKIMEELFQDTMPSSSI